MSIKSKENKYTTENEIELLRKEIASTKLKKSKSGAGFLIARLIAFTLFSTMLVFLCSIFIYVQVLKHSGKTPQIFGYQMYKVESGSMSPTLPIGSVIISRTPENASDIKVGTIVTFERDGAVITHRIIEVVEEDGIKYRTKGDNPLNSPDTELLSPAAVKAVYKFKLY